MGKHSGRGRPRRDLTEKTTLRHTAVEAEMVADMAVWLGGVSKNDAIRWAVRMAWDHDHTDACAAHSACAAVQQAVFGDLGDTSNTSATTKSEATGE